MSALSKLISSLKKNEKRQITLQLSQHKKSNNLLTLFEILCESPALSNQEISEKLKSAKIASQLNVNKHTLYQLILDCLHNFHLRKSPYGRTLMLLHQAELLSGKGQFEEREKLLLKAGKMTDLFELPELKLEVLRLQNTAINSIKTSENILKETKQLSESIIEQASLKHLNNQIIVHNRKGTRSSSIEKKLVRTKLRSAIKGKTIHLNSFLKNYYYYSTISDFDSRLENNDEDYLNMLETVELFKQNPQMLDLQIWRDRYFLTLSRLVATAPLTARKTAIDLVNKEIQNLEVAPIRRSILDMSVLDIYIRAGEFKEGEKYLNEAQKQAKQFKNEGDPYIELVLIFNFSLMNFGMQNYQTALFWLNQLLNDPSRNLVQDMTFHEITEILRLITYFELKKLDELDYHLRSTYRIIKKQQSIYKFHEIILGFLKEIVSINNDHQFVQTAKAARQALLKLSKTEKRIFQYFDVIAWLDAKIQKRSFADVIKENALRFTAPLKSRK